MSDPQPEQQQNLTTLLSVLSAALLAAYATAQLDLLTQFARLIARYGISDLLLLQLRKASKNAAQQVRARVPGLIEQVIEQAAHDGAAAGGTGVPVNDRRGLIYESFESHAERSARAIREDLEGKLNSLDYRITRFADDIYQSLIADAAQAQVLGLTPAEAQHQAYTALSRRGIDGFTDSRGRKWELQAYVDMAVRTAAQRAYNVSHLDRMQALGIELFTVTEDGHPCPLCEPWQGQVLSVEPDSRADATIADATAAGLFHPRCRHTLVGYFPGVTVLPEPHVWDADDEAAYRESQLQRSLERDIRSAKRELAAAFTPDMRSRAQFALRSARKNMRDFIDRTGRVRIPRREQLTL
jgi:hypothetical protein